MFNYIGSNTFSKKRILIFLLFALNAWSVFYFSTRKFPLVAKSKGRLAFYPDWRFVKVASGNFNGFVSDCFYINGILAITDKFKDYMQKVNWIQSNLKITVRLNPYNEGAFFWAGVVIGAEKRSLKKGIEFMKKYYWLNSSSWRIPYWIGFDYYLLKDYLKTARYYQLASKQKGAPSFLKSTQAMLYYKAGREDLGVIVFEGLLASAEGKKEKEWARRKLLWLKNINLLNINIRRFKKLFGIYPKNLQDLKHAGLIKKIPQDTFGRGFYYDSSCHCAKSRFYEYASGNSSPGKSNSSK